MSNSTNDTNNMYIKIKLYMIVPYLLFVDWSFDSKPLCAFALEANGLLSLTASKSYSNIPNN